MKMQRLTNWRWWTAAPLMACLLVLLLMFFLIGRIFKLLSDLARSIEVFIDDILSPISGSLIRWVNGGSR